MWQLLGQAAKSATANATDYVSTVQAKAQSIVATVQEEAVTLLNAMGSARPGPVDEVLGDDGEQRRRTPTCKAVVTDARVCMTQILFEELEDYEAFLNHFQIDQETEEITKVRRSGKDGGNDGGSSIGIATMSRSWQRTRL